MRFLLPLQWIDTSEMYNMVVFTCVRCRSNGAGDGARHELWRGGCRSCQGASAHSASPGHLSRQHVWYGKSISVSVSLPSSPLLFLAAVPLNPNAFPADCGSLFSLYRRPAESRCQRVSPRARRAPGSQGRGEEHQQHTLPGQSYR